MVWFLGGNASILRDSSKLQRVAPSPDGSFVSKEPPTRRSTPHRRSKIDGVSRHLGDRRESKVAQAIGVKSFILRRYLKGRCFSLISGVCLIGALYLPDCFVLANLGDSTLGDLILTVIMVVFLAELIITTLTEPKYLFSTFWMMDLIGAASMMFDITYMFGSQPDEAQIERPDSDGGDEGSHRLVYLRASRIAKLGARAGRISRILKILRFLPFLQVSIHDSTTMAKKISKQLSIVLGTRVAFLTLIVAILAPIPGIFQFPVYDYSLRQTPAALSRHMTELISRGWIDERNHIRYREEDQERFYRELRNTAEFYSVEVGYAPYAAYLGRCRNRPPGCDKFELATESVFPPGSWTPTAEPPYRLADSFIVGVKLEAEDFNTTMVGSKLALLDAHAPWSAFEFVIAFNFRAPHVVESSLNLIVITCIMLIMIGFGLVLSNSVSRLAVQPMERMLVMVRQISNTVFTNFDMEEESDSESGNNDSDTELALLERIVRRLATMAELTTKKVDFGIAKSDLKAEDVGILKLMQGNANVVGSVSGDATSNGGMGGNSGRSSDLGCVSASVLLADFANLSLGVSKEIYDSWSFNPVDIEEVEGRIAIPSWIVFHDSFSHEFAHKSMSSTKFQSFIARAEAEYIDNPYHNFCHGVDIIHTVNRLMMKCHCNMFLSDLEQVSLLIAAIFHDVGHPGVNNPYLIDTGHELAIRYNDRSPLENMHCAKLFSILNEKDTAVLENLTPEQYKSARIICVDVILHTDIVLHFAMVKDLQILYQVNSETLGECFLDSPMMPEEADLFKANDTKKLLMNMFLHTADVSNPCKPWGVCLYWANNVLEEFFQQGDREKELGITVQMLNDRTKVNRPNSQLGFIEFIVAPLIISCIKLFPYVYEFGDNIQENVNEWNKLWVSESNPSKEDQEKVIARLEKIAESVQVSKQRIVDVCPEPVSLNMGKPSTSISMPEKRR